MGKIFMSLTNSYTKSGGKVDFKSMLSSNNNNNQDRLHKLSHRINSLQSNLSNERNQKQEVLETKFNSTIERIFE